ncbi:hypothetical protein M378DRAFT_765675 [Amanita muscaria Koide BX008]|uniref:Uncharacterized protein n=1 Tax=Amanita muscaria (strain Koide BX008) TaxID=946122 RepID=A0A0C2TPI7_AMAMK|nr:hypothetical protein M378DRAFT_765675 [Amanita muscaria Koide BX008]
MHNTVSARRKFISPSCASGISFAFDGNSFRPNINAAPLPNDPKEARLKGRVQVGRRVYRWIRDSVVQVAWIKKTRGSDVEVWVVRFGGPWDDWEGELGVKEGEHKRCCQKCLSGDWKLDVPVKVIAGTGIASVW